MACRANKTEGEISQAAKHDAEICWSFEAKIKEDQKRTSSK